METLIGPLKQGDAALEMDYELISPGSFPAEVGNALIVAERKGRIVAGRVCGPPDSDPRRLS